MILSTESSFIRRHQMYSNVADNQIKCQVSLIILYMLSDILPHIVYQSVMNNLYDQINPNIRSSTI